MPPSVSPAVDIALVRAWVEASCAEQGIQVKVADDGVIRQVVTLLTAGKAENSARRAKVA
jgi:hypothetical protein